MLNCMLKLLFQLVELPQLKRVVLKKMPEAVYLQGQLRILGNAVGLDGGELAGSFLKNLPNAAEFSKKIVPKSLAKNGFFQENNFNLPLLLLYIGLLASSLGILSALEKNNGACSNITEENHKEPEVAPSQPNPDFYPLKQKHKKDEPKLGVPGRQNRDFLSIAPPETTIFLS